MRTNVELPFVLSLSKDGMSRNLVFDKLRPTGNWDLYGKV